MDFNCTEQEISSFRCMHVSFRWLILLHSMGPRVLGLQELWLPGSGVMEHGLYAPRLVGPSGTRIKLIFPALAGRFLTTGPPVVTAVLCLVTQSCPTLQGSPQFLLLSASSEEPYKAKSRIVF